MTGSQQLRRLGYVIVFEDLSDLLKAQKQAAWREVARRVAHEIKNPLTPIALSAERIKRHIERGMRGESSSRTIIESCADTIGSAVETVRGLVDEFRPWPASRVAAPGGGPEPDYPESHGAFRRTAGGLQYKWSWPGLPPVMADPEAIKRVVATWWTMRQRA